MEPKNSSESNSELKKSFVFILNDINVEGELPIEVAPGHFFQKADNEQIKMIKERLPHFMPYIPTPLPYEGKIVKIPKGKQGSFSLNYEPLDEKYWKYHIITFEGVNKELQDIEYAASLLEHDLELGFSFLSSTKYDGFAFSWHQLSLTSFFSDKAFIEPAVTIADDEIQQIFDNYALIKKIDSEHEHVTRALRKFDHLNSLPRNSELIIIGLFSIIESLVTHSPKLTESADSLMHQIKTKIALLSKRFPRKLEYIKYFGEIREENLWKKLYEYRSQIVHGEHSGLTGSLQVLKNIKTVQEFLRETTKLLLLLALQETTLLKDLKKC